MYGTLEKTMETADIRLRVQDLLARYAHCIDDDRLEQWSDFFTEDARYRVISRENHDRNLPLNLIYCVGWGMLKDRISALRTANIYEPHTYCHIVGAPELIGRRGEAIQTRANFTVMRTMAEGDMSVFTCGKYLDEIVERDGELRFSQRTIVLESRRIDTLLVVPI